MKLNVTNGAIEHMRYPNTEFKFSRCLQRANDLLVFYDNSKVPESIVQYKNAVFWSPGWQLEKQELAKS